MVKLRSVVYLLVLGAVATIALSGCARSYEDIAGEKIVARIVQAEDEFSIKMQAGLRGPDFLSPSGIILVDLREMVASDASLAAGQPGMFSVEETQTSMTLGMIACGAANSGGITNNDHRFFTRYELVGTFGASGIEKGDVTCPGWVLELVPVDAMLLPFEQLTFQ